LPTAKPPRDGATSAGAAAKEEVLRATMLNALLNATENDLILPDPEAEILKGSANRASAWKHSPAMLEVNAATDRRLVVVGRLLGMTGNKVLRVHARVVKGTRIVTLRPADENDLTAIPVNRYAGNSSAWINLITLLGPLGLTEEPNYKVRFEIAYSPKASKLWPCLVFDLDQPLARRKTSKKAPIPAEPAPVAEPAEEEGSLEMP